MLCDVHPYFFFFPPDAKRDLQPPACPTKTIKRLRRKGHSQVGSWEVGGEDRNVSIGARKVPRSPPIPPSVPHTKTKKTLSAPPKAGALPSWLWFVYLSKQKKNPKTQERLTPSLRKSVTRDARFCMMRENPSRPTPPVEACGSLSLELFVRRSVIWHDHCSHTHTGPPTCITNSNLPQRNHG